MRPPEAYTAAFPLTGIDGGAASTGTTNGPSVVRVPLGLSVSFSAGLALLPGAEDVSALSAEEKRAALCTLPVGTILYFPGHVMLSWGVEDGEPQCLSAAGNFLPPGSAGGEPRAVNTVAVTPLTVVRANGKTWLESLTKIIRIP